MALFKRKLGNTIDDVDAIFEHKLKVFFNFKDKYPDKIVSIFIYPSKFVTEDVAFDITFVLDGKINYLQSAETSELLEFFELIDADCSFQTFGCTHNTFEKASSSAYVDQKIKAYVRHFMKENPNRNFDLSKTGANIMFW